MKTIILSGGPARRLHGLGIEAMATGFRYIFIGSVALLSSACDSHSVACYQVEPPPVIECVARNATSDWIPIEGSDAPGFEVGEEAVLLQDEGAWILVLNAMNRDLEDVRFSPSEQAAFAQAVAECGAMTISRTNCARVGW